MWYFRGEGSAAYVIGHRSKHTDKRLVWRFKKASLTDCGDSENDAKAQVLFMRGACTQQLGREFVPPARVVYVDAAQAELLFQLHSHTTVSDVEMEQPTSSEYTLTRPLAAVEMRDVTFLPFATGSRHPVVAIEVKPKHTALIGDLLRNASVDAPVRQLLAANPAVCNYCVTCVAQMQKVAAGKYKHNNDFCPLRLYSGNVDAMTASLMALVHNPHNHMRVFRDGTLIHGRSLWRSEQDNVALIEQAINHKHKVPCVSVMQLVAALIAGHGSVPFAGLSPGCIAARLLSAHKQDRIGLFRAAQLTEKCPLTAVEADELRHFLTAGTFKDCSLMFTVQLLDKTSQATVPEQSIAYTVDGDAFAFHIDVIDLDEKKPAKIGKNCERLLSGISHLLEQRPCLPRAPCVPQID